MPFIDERQEQQRYEDRAKGDFFVNRHNGSGSGYSVEKRVDVVLQKSEPSAYILRLFS